MNNDFRYLEFDGIKFAAFIEAKTENEHSGYYPETVMFYVEQGQLNIKKDHTLYTIRKGEFCIVEKFTELSYFKTWEEFEEYAIVDAMILQDDFIREAIKDLGYKLGKGIKPDSVIQLKGNSILLGLFKSLKQYIEDDQMPNKKLVYLKTKEALLGIIQSNPEHLLLFHEFSKSVKADLRLFIEHNRLSSLPLKDLAKLSGRSLSTFNRDFKIIYKMSPHRWLVKSRLRKARELLLTTSKNSTQISLELGFKDLGHFSRSFKKEFGVSPSQIS